MTAEQPRLQFRCDGNGCWYELCSDGVCQRVTDPFWFDWRRGDLDGHYLSSE
jgi:hypothetical protein